MNATNLADTIERIEDELLRLDSLDTGRGGVVVHADDDLPVGWIRISDEAASVCGPAAEILAALEVANDGEPIDPEDAFDDGGPEYAVTGVDERGNPTGEEIGRVQGDHKGYAALWAALDGFSENPPCPRPI